MHPLRAWFMPRSHVLLGVGSREPFLVGSLSPIRWARRRSMPICHVEPTREAHIPIWELFRRVRKFWTTCRRCHLDSSRGSNRRREHGECRCRRETLCRDGQSPPATLTIASSARTTAPSATTAAPLSTAWPASAGDMYRLNWWDVEGMLGWRRTECHRGYLLHDGRLVGR